AYRIRGSDANPSLWLSKAYRVPRGARAAIFRRGRGAAGRVGVRPRRGRTPGQPGSLGLAERHLDPADELGGQVVDHRTQGGESGDEHDVDRAEQRRVAEDAHRLEPGGDVDRRLLVVALGQLVQSEEHTSELQSRENLVCR